MCQPREKPIWDLGAIRLPAATIVPCEIMPAQTPLAAWPTRRVAGDLLGAVPATLRPVSADASIGIGSQSLGDVPGDVATRQKVNRVLANGFSFSYILRALAAENDKLDARHRVTIDSIRNHCVRHFPVQNVARATYRDILERRAKENGVDFVEGVATAITPVAVLETIMVKGYQTLVDERTTVSYRDGMAAALKLAEALREAEGEYDTVHMMAEMSRIIDAVQEFVPREKWPELQAKLRGSHLHPRRPPVRGSLRHRLSGSSPSATGTRKSDCGAPEFRSAL
jgi:hypothetical protein